LEDNIKMYRKEIVLEGSQWTRLRLKIGTSDGLL
jgi:hypothetical protein